MKIIIVFLSLLCLPLSISAQRFNVAFKFDGADREFIVVKPTGAVPAGGYPVVFMFHGSSGDGEQYYTISKWKERGEVEKFITVFPTALKYCVLNFPDNNPVRVTKWNNGNLQEDKCPNVVQDFKDDVKFIRLMVDTIKQTFTVNPKKIFASGFSNGGSMVLKLAMDAPDVFAAVASSGSTLNALDSVRPFRKIPIWSTVGSKDDRFTTPTGIAELPFGGDSILVYLKTPITRVLDCEGLAQTFSKNNTARTNTSVFNTPKTGQAPSTYIFTLVKDMFHVYPNGDNYPLVAADIFWEFFKQSVTTAIPETRLPDTAVNIYPNPSGEAMTLDFLENTEGGYLSVLVFNTLGQQVYASKNHTQTSLMLHKKEIGSGLFIVKINQGQKVATKRIVFE